MANLNIKSNNDKTIAKIDCKGIFIFNTTGCKENSIYLNENVDVYYNDIDFIRNNKYINSIDYVKCALSIITCIRSVREQVYITGECNVY